MRPSTREATSNNQTMPTGGVGGTTGAVGVPHVGGAGWHAGFGAQYTGFGAQYTGVKHFAKLKDRLKFRLKLAPPKKKPPDTSSISLGFKA